MQGTGIHLYKVERIRFFQNLALHARAQYRDDAADRSGSGAAVGAGLSIAIGRGIPSLLFWNSDAGIHINLIL